MLNTQSESKHHYLVNLGPSWLKRRFLRDDSRATVAGKHTRMLCRATRRLGPSPALAMFWRLIAHGTEPGHPAGILLAWPRWEHFARHMWPTMPIPGAPYGLVEMRVAPYEDEPLTLEDGSEIRPGAMVGELHCNNQAILDLVKRNEVNPFSACREDLKSLAAWTRENQLGRQVQAFFGITILARAAARLGFTVRERRSGFRNRLDGMFMTGLLLLYNIEGLARLNKGVALRSHPQEVWLSRRRLIRLYGGRTVPVGNASRQGAQLL